ncbi:hypothetical protein QFC22_001734 [Naganishia vaughanmartiniae]|uniref:Uncharacterized protein n=1 Tax=Naganishia vaughanmartiniae TaxID=1424756 RepID=A0ACC2XFA0_9TREE|nr:hypothetical protein QFC22_001734 [Naganishia vaughanmartiniae]
MSHTASLGSLHSNAPISLCPDSSSEPVRSDSIPLTDTEQHQLRQLIKELSSSPTRQHLQQEDVFKALQVIRSMVRPIRKARKRENRESARKGQAGRILQHTTLAPLSPSVSRTIATQPLPSTYVPQLGCPLPLPLEQSHRQAFGLLLESNSRSSPAPLPIFPSRIAASVASVTRDSLLRAQEALYDVLRMRSTLTYWLHFTEVEIDKTQREELIKTIWKKERPEEDIISVAGNDATRKPVLDNGLERFTLNQYQPQICDRHVQTHVSSFVASPRRPTFTWERVFDGLSALKHDYRRESYEEMGNIISYSLCRGSGKEKEISWIPKAWSRTKSPVDELPLLCKNKAIPAHEQSVPTKSYRSSRHLSNIPFFTPSYGPIQSTSSTVLSTKAFAVRQSTQDPLTIATSHPGHRIPLEHLVQTNLLWETNPVLSASGSPPRLVGVSMFPSKIEWTSPTHVIQQTKVRKTVEEDLYARFLSFVSSESANPSNECSDREQAVSSLYLVPLPITNFKSHAEIFSVRSGIGKDSSLAMSIWRSHWEHQSALLISTDGSSKSEDSASVGVHIGTATPVELKGALPREWAAQGSYTAEWFAICYALWLSLDMQKPTYDLPNISGRSRLVFCTDSSGIITSITKPLRVHDKDTSPAIKPWTNVVRLCRRMIAELAKEGKDIKFTWMPRLSTIGLTRAHELADDVYGKIASSSSTKQLKEKRTRQPCEVVIEACTSK